MDAYSMLVRDVMVEDVQSVSAEDTLRDALEVMLDNGLTTLPVVSGGQKCRGIIAAVDMLPASEELDDEVAKLASRSGEETAYVAETVPLRGLASHAVEDFMSTNVVSVTAETTLPAAAAMMLQNQIHHLIVVDTQGHIIGILSTMDILEAFARPALEKKPD